MTPDEEADESAAAVMRHYAKMDELSIIVRTHGSDVRVIAPDVQRGVLAKMLRIAASMLEGRTDQTLN